MNSCRQGKKTLHLLSITNILFIKIIKQIYIKKKRYVYIHEKKKMKKKNNSIFLLLPITFTTISEIASDVMN
jgi:hypothetical protein